MTVTYLAYVLFGGLLIFGIQKFPLTGWLSSKAKFLEELFTCQFCLGFWVYLFLSFFFEIRIEFIPQIPLLSNFLIALGTSFVVWLVITGWKTLFQVTYIE